MGQNPNEQFQPGEPRRANPSRPAPDESAAFNFDEGEGEAVRRYKRNWLDDQFGGTAIWVLVLFAVCCGYLAFAFSLAGVIGCNDPRAKRNALIVLCISVSMMAISLMYQFADVLVQNLKR
jgi:hypothetical protein